MMMYTDAISAHNIVSGGRYFNSRAALSGKSLGFLLNAALVKVRRAFGKVEGTNKSLATYRITLAASQALRTGQTSISLLSLLTGGSDETN